MYKSYFTINKLIFTAFLFLFFSCRKDCDIKQSTCRITKITTHRQGLSRTGIFEYNSFGNPISITYNKVSSGYSNYVFHYDAQNKLTEAITMYANGYYELWHKYQYNNNVIIKDSIYVFGKAENPEVTSFDRYQNVYEYDGNNRISKIISYRDGGTTEKTFSYDGHGNLIVPGITYDDKACLRSTHKVWMFLDANYSVNNPIKAVSYNQSNLPLAFNSSTNNFSFLSDYLDTAEIEYSCN